MARLGPEIMDDDEECDVASFFMEACGLDYGDFIANEKILTREIWEINLEKVLEIVEERASRRATYFVFGYFTLFTGSRLPAHIRPLILDAAKWEYEEGSWLNKEFAIERKFYLEDFRQKIRDHRPGKSIRLIFLKNGSEDITYGVVGLDKFWEYVISKKIFDVKHVNLDGCNLTEIPEPIFELVNLKTLSLERNHLIRILDLIGNLSSLERLDLCWNLITEIPNSIGELKSLKSLSLSHNKIDRLPSALKDLDSLEYLYLRDNNIAHFPAILKNMISLKDIDLDDNKLSLNSIRTIKSQFY